jgi:hypothetical protein
VLTGSATFNDAGVDDDTLEAGELRFVNAGASACAPLPPPPPPPPLPSLHKRTAGLDNEGRHAT